MERTLRISIGSKWNDRYTRLLGIVDHIHELAAIDDEIRREKNRGTPGETPDAAVRNLEAHFRQELADLMLIALNELGDDEIEARRRKFLEKDASPAMPSADEAISKLYKDLLASMPDRKAAEEAMEAMEERKD